MQLVSDAFVGEAHKFGERHVGAAGPARQQRNEAGQRRPPVTLRPTMMSMNTGSDVSKTLLEHRRVLL
jgi:hypothetical protein